MWEGKNGSLCGSWAKQQEQAVVAFEQGVDNNMGSNRSRVSVLYDETPTSTKWQIQYCATKKLRKKQWQRSGECNYMFSTNLGTIWHCNEHTSLTLLQSAFPVVKLAPMHACSWLDMEAMLTLHTQKEDGSTWQWSLILGLILYSDKHKVTLQNGPHGSAICRIPNPAFQGKTVRVRDM